ncbi:MAG: glycosyltransferase, partial [Bacteroidota bacterium]
SQVWPNSPSLLNFINKNKLTQSHKLKMISKGSSNGIDLKKFSPENVSKSSLEEIKKNHSLTPGCTYSLFVGRLVKDKGIDILIRAFQSMKIKEHQLVLLGSFEKDHDLLPETLEAIQKNNSIIHIEWAKNVKDYMALADLLIHPSFREGFPNVLLQAGAMRTPIICSAIPGNIDIIKHKHTGLVYESLSEIELVKQLSWAFLNWDKMTEYADKLYNIVHENYGRNKIHSTILQNYNRLIYE